MTKYIIAGLEYVVMDGLLWQRVPAQNEQIESLTESRPERAAKVKRGRPKGKGKRIPEETVANLRKEYADGARASELAEKYGVSIAAVYKNTAGVSRTSNRYVCVNGHRFQTNLNMLDAKCPSCGSHDLERAVDKPVSEASA